ncbi:MAG: YjbQ family protein [Calditrichaeota bacterium]|nr:YjbQ family protein [Calditrichota bacterium]RQW06381.1 MAG: YjbQ family protein [Calditrichota bacterium]
MEILTRKITLETKGFTDIIDISPLGRKVLEESGMQEGQLTVFVPGSTGGITTIEYEPGLLEDLPEFLERIIPANRTYHHDRTWHDGNGYAHLRSALIKTSFTTPFAGGKLLLGTWQQIIFIDFDNRKRHRELIFQCIGMKKAD